MADMGRRLEAWGADFLAISCNTAHYYYDAVREAVHIPVINLIDLVANHVKDQFPELSKVGILASPAVAMTGLYTERFRRLGIEDIWPDPDHQERLLNVIKAIKSGNTDANVRAGYRTVCENLKHRGATAAIIACTELSALGGKLPIDALDAAEILAQEIVAVAKNRKDPV
jgi:aspartate racemase